MEQDTGMEQLKESEEENTSDWNQNRGQQVERTPPNLLIYQSSPPDPIAHTLESALQSPSLPRPRTHSNFYQSLHRPRVLPLWLQPLPAHCLAGLRRDLPCCFLAARSSFQYAPPEAGAQGAAPREATGYRDGAGQTMKG